jgi:hypothetical protein
VARPYAAQVRVEAASTESVGEGHAPVVAVLGAAVKEKKQTRGSLPPKGEFADPSLFPLQTAIFPVCMRVHDADRGPLCRHPSAASPRVEAHVLVPK